MLRNFACAAAIAACATVSALAPAHAVETFICEDGSAVTVAAGQLEAMKATNACVARHYGLEVGSEVRPVRATLAVPMPSRRPERRVGGVPVARVAASRTPVSSGSSQPITTGSIVARDGVPEAGTYRRVKILNPAPGGSPYYLHTR